MDQDFALNVENSSLYTTGNYPSMTPAAARKRIVTLLKSAGVAINVHDTDSSETSDFAADVDLTGEATMDGITWVTVHVQGASDTGIDYKIEMGKPVCWDFVTGEALTGVNPKWGSDEAYILGTALHDFDGPGYGQVPVKLERPGSVSDPETAVVQVQQSSAGDLDFYPITAFSKCIWKGKILKPKMDAASFCFATSFDDRYEAGADVWMMPVDALNGSSTGGATLTYGARYVCTLVGSYSIGSDTRPLYVFHRSEQTAILEITDPNDSDTVKKGQFVDPNTAGLFFAKVVFIQPDQTGFSVHDNAFKYGPEPVYVVFVDKMWGNSTTDVRCRKGERYIGKLDQPWHPASGPLSARPLYAVRRGYDTGIPFKNTASEAVPAYGCMAVVAGTSENDVVCIEKPSTALRRSYLCNGPEQVEAGEYGYAQRGLVLLALYTGATPQPDWSYGPTPEHWYVTKGNPPIAICHKAVLQSREVMQCSWQPVMKAFGKAYNSIPKGTGSGTMKVHNADTEVEISGMIVSNIVNKWCSIENGKWIEIDWPGTNPSLAKGEQ